MKNSFLFVISLILLLSFDSVLAKRGKKRAGMIPYKSETVTTIKGKVRRVKTVFNRIQQEKGLHLTVKSSSGSYIVHVCPQWYADKQKIQFFKGESISITGSTFTKDGKQNIYAASIRRGPKTLNLRNVDTGVGLWSERYKDGTKRERRLKKRMKRQRER